MRNVEVLTDLFGDIFGRQWYCQQGVSCRIGRPRKEDGGEGVNDWLCYLTDRFIKCFDGKNKWSTGPLTTLFSLGPFR